MAEYIEREAALSVIQKLNTPLKSPAQKDMLRTASVYIQAIPADDIAPVVHGRWVIVDDGVMIGDGKHMECSVCHTWKKDRIKTDYCPNCGARMDLEG